MEIHSLLSGDSDHPSGSRPERPNAELMANSHTNMPSSGTYALQYLSIHNANVPQPCLLLVQSLVVLPSVFASSYFFEMPPNTLPVYP